MVANCNKESCIHWLSKQKKVDCLIPQSKGLEKTSLLIKFLSFAIFVATDMNNIWQQKRSSLS